MVSVLHKQKIPSSILGKHPHPYGVASGKASGIKTCQIKHAGLLDAAASCE